MWDVLGVGANSIDRVYRLPQYPQPAGPAAKLRILSHTLSPGGQTATVLATCAAMGLRTKYIGTFGNDAGARLVREELTRRGVDIEDAIECNAPNPWALILLDTRTGERGVLWDRDERARLKPADVGADLITAARLVHVDDVDPDTAVATAALARLAGIRVTSDIEQVTELTEPLMAAVDIPIFAEPVPEALTGESDPERALRKLRLRHPGLLCVTMGSGGAMLLDGDRLHHAQAPTVSAVDTTGAGDVFRGAFIHALLRGDSAPEILRFANAAAALSCTRPGAIRGVPTLAEVNASLGAPGT